MTSYSAADMALVKAALIAECSECNGDTYCLAHFVQAGAILTALADAGRLTPAGAEQPRVKITQIWYRSLQADGSVWCESGNAREVVRMSKGIAAKFERLVIAEVTGVWEPWVAADGTP
jgi:hypothetical protein